MTMSEYVLRLEAYQLQKIERQQELVELAFYYRNVKATDNKGKRYKFKTPNDMFKHDFMIDKIRSKFEEDYKPMSQEKLSIDRAKEISRRMAEWKNMQKGGK